MAASVHPAAGEAAPRVAVVGGDTAARRRAASVLDGAGLAPLVAAAADRLGAAVDVIVVVPPAGTRISDAVDEILSAAPGAKIVVVTSRLPAALRDVFADRVYGLVLDGELERCLALAVASAAAEQVSLPGALRGLLGRPSLSAREKQVLGMVVLGLTNGEIAGTLHLTESTVKSHLSSAYRKLGVRSRSEAVTRILDPASGLGTGILAISEEGLARAGSQAGSLLHHE